MRPPREPSLCALCDYFKLKGQPGEKEGRGLCTMYERPESWDWNSCVLYKRAATFEARRRWVEKFTQQKAATPQEEGNGTDEKV